MAFCGDGGRDRASWSWLAIRDGEDPGLDAATVEGGEIAMKKHDIRAVVWFTPAFATVVGVKPFWKGAHLIYDREAHFTTWWITMTPGKPKGHDGIMETKEIYRMLKILESRTMGD